MSLAAFRALALGVLLGCGSVAPDPWDEGPRLCPLGDDCDEKPADPVIVIVTAGGAGGGSPSAADAGEER